MCDSLLKEYEEKVVESIENNYTTTFGNYSVNHARCVIKLFVESAKKNVILLSGCLSDCLYDEDLKKKLSEKKELGVDVKIIILSDYVPKNFLDSSCILNLSNSGKNLLSHFMVVDEKRYRLEVPHDEDDDDKFKAESCANGKVKAKFLTDIFNVIWNKFKR